MNSEVMAAAKIKARMAQKYSKTSKDADKKSMQNLAKIDASKASVMAGLAKYKTKELASKDKAKLAKSTVHDAESVLSADKKYFSKAMNNAAMSKAGISMST